MAISIGGSGSNGSLGGFVPALSSSVFNVQPIQGSTIVVGTHWQWETNVNDTVTSVVDNAGNTYTRIQSQSVAGGQRAILYYAKNINTISNFSVTASYTNPIGAAGIIAVELKGTDTIAPLDLNSGSGQPTLAAGTDAIIIGDMGTPSTNNQIVIVYTGGNSGVDSYSAGTGYTLIGSSTTPVGRAMEYLLQTTAALVQPRFTFAGSPLTCTTVAATFKADGGGGSSISGKPIRIDQLGTIQTRIGSSERNVFYFNV